MDNFVLEREWVISSSKQAELTMGKNAGNTVGYAGPCGSSGGDGADAAGTDYAVSVINGATRVQGHNVYTLEIAQAISDSNLSLY